MNSLLKFEDAENENQDDEVRSEPKLQVLHFFDLVTYDLLEGREMDLQFLEDLQTAIECIS